MQFLLNFLYCFKKPEFFQKFILTRQFSNSKTASRSFKSAEYPKIEPGTGNRFSIKSNNGSSITSKPSVKITHTRGSTKQIVKTKQQMEAEKAEQDRVSFLSTILMPKKRFFSSCEILMPLTKLGKNRTPNG